MNGETLLRDTFALAVRPDRDRTFIVLSGELDLTSAPAVESEVDGLLERGFDHIVLDLRDLTFIDSCGIRALVRCRREALEHGARLSIIRGPRPVERALELCGLRDHFDVVVAPRFQRAQASPQSPWFMAGPRLERLQVLRRTVNEALRAGCSPNGSGPRPFLCECGALGCNDLLELTPEEYADVRAHPGHFVIVPDHEIPGIDTVADRRLSRAVVVRGDAAG